MGSRAITEPLALTTDYVSLDGRYTDENGNPYASVAAAEAALGRRMNQYTVGLTVLVKESSWTKAKEYWVQPKGTTPETYGLVLKGSSDIDIDTEQIEGGTRVIITDAEGTVHSFDVKDGSSYSTGYYYGQYTSENELPQQTSVKGYAYVATQDPAVYIVYTISGEGGTWENSGEKFVTTSLETNLASKSQTKAPTTKVVAEGIEAVDVTTQQSFTNSQKETARTNIGAQENIPAMQNVQPVVAALNNRAADVVPVTNEVKALGYRVLNPELSFASQVTEANTIYEIKDEFEVAGSATIPANCTLKFNGGAVRGSGSLTLANTKLEGNITFGRELHVSGKATNDIINVAWFGAVGDGVTDDSNALKNAIAVLKQKNSTLVFGDGKTYLHGDGIADLTNDPDMTLHTGYSYPRASENPDVADYLHPSGPVIIGRDIMLRFLGFDGLTIEGNGSTIVSNPNNGICMHNSIFFFGACANMSVRNLLVDDNRTTRVENADVEFNDWSRGTFPSYPNGIVNSWKDGIWLESSALDNVQKGYNLVSSIYILACHNVLLDNVISTDPIMDGIFINKAEDTSSTSDGYCYNILVDKCTFNYAARLGIALGQGVGINVINSTFEHNGYNTNGEINNIASTNHGGFGAELESEPLYFDKITCTIELSKFNHNDGGGVKFSTGVENSTCKNCTFVDSRVSYRKIYDPQEWKKSRSNNLIDNTFLNCRLSIGQEGTNISGNVFNFDKDWNKDYSSEDAVWFPYFINWDLNGTQFSKPILFENNQIKCDITGLTKENDGVTYFDASKTKGQGRIRIVGTPASCIVRNNVFKDICPTDKSFEGFQGKSGIYFYTCVLKGIVIENNTISSSISNVSFENGEVVSYNGLIRSHVNIDYSIYDADSIMTANNSIAGSTNFVKIQQSGTTSQRPNLLRIVGKDIDKIKFFQYKNTDRGGRIETFSCNIKGDTSLASITSERPNELSVQNNIGEGTKYFVARYFPLESKPKIYFTKISNIPSFELNKYYATVDSSETISSKPSDWDYNFNKYYEIIDGEKVHVTGVSLDEVLVDAIEVKLVYTSYSSASSNMATGYATVPNSGTYPYILCVKDGIYSTTTQFRYSKIDPRWTYEDGYAATDRKGTTANRPVGLHLDNGDYVGDLTSEDVGMMYFDTDLKKPIYVASVNDTTGTVLWVDGLGEPAGLQVSDTFVLIAAADNSTQDVSVYYGGTTAPTITVLNSDDSANTWLTAAPDPFTGNTLTLTAAANDTSAPRGAKVLVTLDDELVIINVVQSY